MRWLVGVIRVITLEDPVALGRHGEIIERTVPQVKTVSRCIEDQPRGIYDEESERVAIPKILRLGHELVERYRVHGVVVSCAGDPGVDELRSGLGIPVVGAGRAAAALALSVGERVGVLGITDEPPKPFEKVLRDRMVAYEKPRCIGTTLDIERCVDGVVESARRLASSGADVIALACTGYSTAGLAPVIEERTGVKVVDPVVAEAVVMYWELVRHYSQGVVLR